MTLTHTPLCTVRYCPAKSDPDWHQCVVCQDPAIEHHHVENRGMGGSKRDIPVIALCHDHHEKITLNEWSSGVLPDGRIVIWGLHGNTIWESHGNGRREEEAGAAGVPGTLPDTGLPEGPSFPELDFGPDYLNLPEEFRLEDAVPWAAMVGKWEHGRQWYAGDLLLACEARFGHERLWGHSVSPDGKTFVDLLGMTYPSLRNCQRVCEAFSPGERFPLSFGHHAAVYKHPERDRLMEQATAEGWTVSRLRQAATGHVEPAKHDCPSCGAEHRVKEAQ